jgi:hypothetical protein
MENKSITHEQTGYTLLYYTGRAPLQLGKVQVRSTAVDCIWVRSPCIIQ